MADLTVSNCLMKSATPSSSARIPSTANHFHPNVWEGYNFVPSSEGDSKKNLDEAIRREMKEEVKSLLSLAAKNPAQELDLIDKIQRLGVACYFESEIEDILRRIYSHDYTSFLDGNLENDSALYYVSLWFRLLRHAGFYVSPVVFNMFKDEKGEFKENLVSDVQGMLSLYEASYLGFNGEDILDEAMAFATKHLTYMGSHLSSSLALQVEHALKMPIRASNERVHARHYISIYQEDESRNETLLQFAKLDYNALQLISQNEIAQLSEWWSKIDIKSKIPFDIRDRSVEAYAITNIFFEPDNVLGRMHLAKIWCMISLIDDAYDVYGDMVELEPLCEAFQRWEAGSELADHMKAIFDVLLNVFNGIDADMMTEGHHHIGMQYMKKEIKIYTKGLLEEAKIIFSKDLPTLKEWFQISLVTIAYIIYLYSAVMNLGKVATKEFFDWGDRLPKIIRSSSLFVRLVGDIASLELEQERGITATSVPCYMKEYGVLESEAIEALQKMVRSVWKDINQGCLREDHVPMSVKKVILNFNRNIALYYRDGDGYSISKGATQEIIASIFLDPIPI